MPDESGPDAARGSEGRPSIDPRYLAALDELDARLSEQGVHLHLYAHRGMTVAVAHCEGDKTSTIEDALAHGAALLDKLAAEIAEQRSLPHDWLTHLSGPPEPTEQEQHPTLIDRIRIAGIKLALQLAQACRRTARTPEVGRLRKRAVLAGMRLAVLAIMAIRKLPAKRDPARRRTRGTRSGG